MKKIELTPFTWGFCVVGFLGLIMIGCKQEEGSSNLRSAQSGRVKVEVYVTAKCPFGVRAENAMAPVLKKMGKSINFSLDFVGSIESKSGGLVSARGEAEIIGAKAQVCAMDIEPDAYMDLVLCMNKNWQQIPAGWESCAEKTGISVDKLKTCVEGRVGHELLKASFERSTARKMRSSPAVFINNNFFKGAITEDTFARTICAMIPKDKPAYCASVPPPAKLPIVVISDKQCKQCNTEIIDQQMHRYFEAVDIKILDVGSEEGKKLYTELKLSKLPVVLFTNAIKEQYAYVRFQRVVEQRGDYLVTSRWGVYDPSREICDNKKDDNGNQKVDCADPQCRYSLSCRKEVRNKLEVFVMSQCPFGVKALDSMKEVLDNFKGKINFKIHYIANEIPGGAFSSLHGQPEVDENIRMLCAAKRYLKKYKYMDYIWCRNKDIRNKNWPACTGKVSGIKQKAIESCVNSKQGRKLLSTDIKIAKSMDVGASPSWVVNNKHMFSGIDPETIKTNFCKYNRGLKGCKNTLSGKKENSVNKTCK